MGQDSTKRCKNLVCRRKPTSLILKYDYSGRILGVPFIRRPIGVGRVSALSELNVGDSGVLVALKLPESVQNHLMHMGFVPDALVTVLRRAPAGDPTVYGIDGMEIALRYETAAAIHVRQPESASDTQATGQPELAPEPAEVAR